jgi:hypothetical protein
LNAQIDQRQVEKLTGLEKILEILEIRYEYDNFGRIVDVFAEGILPRFVLGRSAEGCIWRFSANLEADCVNGVARLAARELGFPIEHGIFPAPPERLGMIERLLTAERSSADTSHEILVHGGAEVAELWTIS